MAKPREGAHDVLKLWNGQFQQVCGQGLERWAERHPDKQKLEPPPFLTMTMDWEQVQWCAGFFLRNKMNLYVEFVPDFEHVRNANLAHAGHEAGELLTIARAHIVNNCRRGPWNGKIWSGLMKDAALSLSRNLHPNSPWLLYFWPCIVESMGIETNGDSLSARRTFLDELPGQKICTRNPPTSSAQRWMSMQKCSQYLDKYTGVDRMLYAYVCLQRHFITRVDELLPSRRSANEIENEYKKFVPAAPAEEGDNVEEVEGGGEPEAQPTAAEVSQARAAGKAMPKKCKSLAKAKAAAKAQARKEVNNAKKIRLRLSRSICSLMTMSFGYADMCW